MGTIGLNVKGIAERGSGSDDADRERLLVERAQQGDTEAFGELIEQHRGRAKIWAERITGDPHMADDIVQDALIRAFLHVGSLADTSRFLPWLNRIVRNQANMRLRRGGPYGKEKPFAAYRSVGDNTGSVDWDDLDSVLYHLTRSASDAAVKEQDPAEHLLRKELYETIHALLHCLTRKERTIFEAYFFRQLDPDEIAAMYLMTTGSIYTYIHRSRRKLREEHIRVSLGLLPEKGGSGLTKSKLLELPEWPAHASVKMSFVDRIGHMLAALGDRRETAELMGLSGFAFFMQLSNKTTFADGIYVFDWRKSLQAFMQELGYEAAVLCGQLSESPVPLLGAVERFPVVLPIEEAVMPFIRKYIDQGKPVLYFDTAATRPYVHEWSLIYGYDDEGRLVHVTDMMRPEGKTLSYEDVADNPVRFLAGVDGKVHQESTGPDRRSKEMSSLRRIGENAIRRAVNFARNGSNYSPMTVYLSYTSGLAAYDKWIQHLRRGPESPPNRYGMGQLAAVYAETKRYAALYLRSLPLEGEAMRLALLASEAYEQAADRLAEISAMVPFVRTSEMLSPERCGKCAELLERAKEFEAAAVGYLEKTIIT
ncbi:RNA polymerase sigma factor [Paenibacillus tarimensis]